MDVQTYQDARMACEHVRAVLAARDFSKLLEAIERAHALGPIMDPTLYCERCAAMDEDAKVFRAALAFLGAWPAKKEAKK